MAKIETPVVHISKAAICNIIKGISEKHEKEAIGDLVGKTERDGIIITNSCPWVQAQTTAGQAWYGDSTKQKRSIKINQALESLGSSGVIGQYHTHFYPSCYYRGYIHKPDMDYFREMIDLYELEESIQIISSVRARQYKERKTTGTSVRHYPKKLRTIVCYDPFKSYDVTFAAYKLNHRNTKELKLQLREIEVKSSKRFKN